MYFTGGHDMDFIGIRDLSQRTSAYVRRKDWIVITKNGKPVKIMIDINAEDLEDFILAKHLQLEKELRNAARDANRGKLKTLAQILPRRRKAA